MTSLNKLVRENNICSLPWLLAEIQLHRGYIGPCCKYEGDLGSLKEKEFPVIWFGEKFKGLRQDMEKGKVLEECRACHIAENVFSYKDKKNRDFYNFLYKVDTLTPILPKVVHIGLTNICNLSCRMCNPNQSSKLNQFISKSSKLKSFYPVLDVDNKIDIQKLKGSFAETEIVTFVGGEPMIDDSCLEILRIIKQESTKLRSVAFITNLTQLNTDILDIVNSLNTEVVLSVSIDGPPKLQEYIRHYAKWNDIYSNMEYIRKNYPKVKFGSNSTLSLLNIGYVADTVKFFHELETDLKMRFKFVQPSVVTDKRYLHAGNLPDEIKTLYRERIDNYKGPVTIPLVDQLLSSAKGLLAETANGTLDEFFDFIEEFDKFAGTTYSDLYPELGALTKNRT